MVCRHAVEFVLDESRAVRARLEAANGPALNSSALLLFLVLGTHPWSVLHGAHGRRQLLLRLPQVDHNSCEQGLLYLQWSVCRAAQPALQSPPPDRPTERSAATAAVSWIRFPDAGSGADVDTCAGKPPTTCSVRCATTFVPFHEKCGSRLNVLYDSADGTSSDTLTVLAKATAILDFNI